MVPKNKRLNSFAHVVAEKAALLRLFPTGQFIEQSSLAFKWFVEIKPTSLSKSYELLVMYEFGKRPDVFILTPLDRYGDAKDLPHVYSTKQQKICLYYPTAHEWSKDKLIANTILPWAAEWLQFYELWVATGVWLGEGVHHAKSDDKSNVKEKI